jgi:serine/threonine protein phosphatase PrpC
MDEQTVGNGELRAQAVHETLSWGIRSHVGPVREHNEDFVGVYAATTPDDSWDRPPLFVIADGMGGHAAGEVASRVAVEAALERWRGVTPPSAVKGLRAAFRDANLAVIDAAEHPGRRGMGTTMTALSLSAREACIAHVGDSRAYLVRRDSCTQVTVDHSRAGDMLRMRLITSEQAMNHPARSQLTRSLGNDPLLQVDVHRHPVERGDIWVLCSDGLWDVVGSRDIVETMGAFHSRAPGHRDLVAVADRLVETAVERQTADNVSVVVVQITSDRPIPPEVRRSVFRIRA